MPELETEVPQDKNPSTEKTLINLAEKLSDLEQKTLASELIADYDTDVISRQSWMDKRNKWYKLWLCQRDAKVDPWPGASNICFSVDTEILTKDGWSLIGDVQIGDLVYTRDENGNGCYKPVTNTIFEYSDKLIHFKSRCVDIKVTPQHRMLVQSDRTGKTRFVPAENFLSFEGGDHLPLTSHYNEGEKPDKIRGVDARSYVRFLGWYISEGSACYGKTKGGLLTTGSFNISQSNIVNPEKFKILEEDIRATGFSYKINSNRQFTIHARSMPIEIKEELRAIGRSAEKHIPQHILLLHPSLLGELIDTLVLGDGHISRGQKYYFTGSKQLADDIQVLCQKIGLRATITAYKRKIRKGNLPEFIVRICTGKKTRYRHIDRKLIAGEHVACVEVPPYNTVFVRRNDKAIWCGNCIPMLSTACNQFHGRAYSSVFAPPGMVKAMPVEGNDVQRAKNVENYLNWQVLYEMEEYEDEFDRLLINLPINGTAFKKVYYDKTLDRNVSEYVSAVNIVLPYRTKKLESARRVAHEIWLHYDELSDRNDQGLYVNFDQVKEVAGKKDNTELSETKDRAVGEDDHSGDNSPKLVLEIHKKHKLFDDMRPQPYIFTVDYDSGTILRITSRTVKIGGKEHVLSYFIDYHFIPNPEGFYSFGFGHFLEVLNEMANTAFNQIFDSGRLTNTPFGFYGRRAGLKKRQIKLMPGLMTEVDDASQVYFPSMQRVDQILFQVLGLIQQYSEQLTSNSDYLMGRESKGTKTPTASGTLAIIEQGLVTFGVMTKRIFRQLKKELRLIYTLNSIYLPESKQFRILGEDQQLPFPTIKRVDFDGKMDIIPIGDPSFASKSQRRQEAIELYQMMIQNPLVGVNPATGQIGNPRAIWELTNDLLDAYDKKNKRALLPPMPSVPISPDVENAMFVQGDYNDPQVGENHQQHMSVHDLFILSPFYQSMPEEYKALHKKHMEKPKSLMVMEAQAKAAMGAMPEGGMPMGMDTKQPQPMMTQSRMAGGMNTESMEAPEGGMDGNGNG